MRGAPIVILAGTCWMRIIPAYAGSTHDYARAMQLHKDHPRVCGEHFGGGAGEEPRRGSSPRMRGALVVLVERDLGAGIIPAYAGSTRPSARTS